MYLIGIKDYEPTSCIMNYILMGLLLLFSNVFYAQQRSSDAFYINVFINRDKEIRIESNLVSVSEIGNEVKNLVYQQPFKVGQAAVFRMYADQSIALGYIMKIEQKMLEAHSYQVRRERYLLETLNMNLDGPDWLEKIRGLDLKPVGG